MNMVKSSWIGIGILILMEVVFMLQPVLIQSNIILYIACMSIFVAIGYHLQSSVFFRVALCLVLLSFVSMYMGQFQIANRLAILIFFLIAIGLIRTLQTMGKPTDKKRKTV